MKNFKKMTGVCFSVLLAALTAFGQEPTEPEQDVFPGFNCGQAVVTCFSGFENGIPSSGFADAHVVGIVDVRTLVNTTPDGMNSSVPMIKEPGWTYSNMGQVYGIAIDDQNNVYLASSAIYGKFNDPVTGLDGTFGPGSGGEIYRIDHSDGSVSQFVGTEQTNTNTVGTNTIYNLGTGLGNICYDPQNHQIFASNFTDGLIYRIDMNGIVQSTFDHPGANVFGSTDPNFAPLGDRPFGLAVHQGNLYYGLWNEDMGSGRSSSQYANEIWSVSIAGGDFNGSPQCEIELPAFVGAYSHPPADLAFSEAGRLLVGERSMNSDYNQYVGSPAHHSRIIEYAGMLPLATNCNPAWGTPKVIYIGNFGTHANSAGGVDYGYGGFDLANNHILDCDSVIWGVGDALKFGTNYNHYLGDNQSAYGIAGMPSQGNSTTAGPDFVKTSSYYIDLRGGTTIGKGGFGDVEIFKCGCPSELASVGDRVWNDTDQDGLQDAGEPGIAGVVVHLKGTDNQGNPVYKTQITSSTGHYLFDDVAAGSYHVHFVLPSGYIYPPQNAGTDDDLDSDAASPSGKTATFAVAAGDEISNLDAGIFLCQNCTDPGTIAGKEILCGPGNDPGPITSQVPPNCPGTGYQIFWMRSLTADVNGPWEGIPGANGLSYDPGPIAHTTHYIRCVKMGDCFLVKESNIVTKSVDDKAVADITGPTSICVQDDSIFKATANANGAVYTWNFGNKATPATAVGIDQHVQWSTPGVYQVQLEVRANGCTSRAALAVSVTDSPVYCGN